MKTSFSLCPFSFIFRIIFSSKTRQHRCEFTQSHLARFCFEKRNANIEAHAAHQVSVGNCTISVRTCSWAQINFVAYSSNLMTISIDHCTTDKENCQLTQGYRKRCTCADKWFVFNHRSWGQHDDRPYQRAVVFAFCCYRKLFAEKFFFSVLLRASLEYVRKTWSSGH